MRMLPFREFAKEVDEPFKTLLNLMDALLSQNFFENFVIQGEYKNDEKVEMSGWSTIALAPGEAKLLECHVTAGPSEADKALNLSKLREATTALQVPKDHKSKDALVYGGALHTILGLQKYHILGMLSIHQGVETKKEFAVLWKHPRIQRNMVEEIMKTVLSDRLK